MIMCLCIILVAFYWLLIETDFMRLRLPMGEVEPVRRVSWEDIKTQYLNKLTKKQTPKWYSNPETYPPICGQAWLESTMHVIPETKIELKNCVHRYVIKSNNSEALRDAFRVYRNPSIKVKLT